MIELRDLHLIRAVARAGSLTGAAEELYISQPAASQQMRSLEARLDARLITRTSRGVQLTAAGKVLLKHADSVHQLVQSGLRELADVANLNTGQVRLATFAGAGLVLATRTLSLMSSRFPQLEFSLIESEPREAIRLVDASEADIAIAYEYPGDDILLDRRVERYSLGRDELVLAIPEGHELASGDAPIEMASLAEQTWIAGCEACRRSLAVAGAQAGISPNVQYSADDSLAIQDLVSAGLGIALISSILVERVALPGVVFRTISPAPNRELFAVVREDHVDLPSVGATLAALLRQSAERT